MYFTREPDIGNLLMICERCGFRDVPALINWYLFKESCPALCLSCGYIEDQPPDTFAGWCPVCDTDTGVLGLNPGRYPLACWRLSNCYLSSCWIAAFQPH